MKTLEELKQEAELAQQKLEEAEHAAREEARKAERELRKAQEIAKRDVARKANIIHAEKIVNELVKAGYPKATWKFDDNSMTAYPDILEDGEHEDAISFNSMGGSWTGRGGTAVVEVGGYSNRSRFPIKKDGTFSYDKIVAKYVEHVAYRKSRQERSAKDTIRYQTNSKLREKVCKATGISEWSGIVAPGGYEENTVTVNIKISLDGDSAIKFIDSVKAMGFTLS